MVRNLTEASQKSSRPDRNWNLSCVCVCLTQDSPAALFSRLEMWGLRCATDGIICCILHSQPGDSVFPLPSSPTSFLVHLFWVFPQLALKQGYCSKDQKRKKKKRKKGKKSLTHCCSFRPLLISALARRLHWENCRIFPRAGIDVNAFGRAHCSVCHFVTPCSRTHSCKWLNVHSDPLWGLWISRFLLAVPASLAAAFYCIHSMCHTLFRVLGLQLWPYR